MGEGDFEMEGVNTSLWAMGLQDGKQIMNRECTWDNIWIQDGM